MSLVPSHQPLDTSFIGKQIPTRCTANTCISCFIKFIKTMNEVLDMYTIRHTVAEAFSCKATQVSRAKVPRQLDLESRGFIIGFRFDFPCDSKKMTPMLVLQCSIRGAYCELAIHVENHISRSFWRDFAHYSSTETLHGAAFCQTDRLTGPGIIELLCNEMYSGELGPSTLVGTPFRASAERPGRTQDSENPLISGSIQRVYIYIQRKMDYTDAPLLIKDDDHFKIEVKWHV